MFYRGRTSCFRVLLNDDALSENVDSLYTSLKGCAWTEVKRTALLFPIKGPKRIINPFAVFIKTLTSLTKNNKRGG